MNNIFCLIGFILFFEFSSTAQTVQNIIDQTFAGSGTATKAITGGDGTDDRANAVAIQPDGKIVIAGYSQNGFNSAFALVRYNINGTIDNTFGTNGIVRNAIDGGDGRDGVNSVVIQSDGKIIAAGSAGIGFALARYNSNGTPDSTFGINGTVINTINGGYGLNDGAQSVAIQSDGKIVAAGYSQNSLGVAFALARYNSDGTLDTTFGTNGTVRNIINGGDEINDQAVSVAIQSDGKIVAAGSSWRGSGYSSALARYESNGTPDNTFGNNGTIIISLTNSIHGDGISSLAIQPDGKIVTAGTSAEDTPSFAFQLARFNSDGTLDNTFGSNGSVRNLINGSSGGYDGVSSLALQSDGKIVVAGNSTSISGKTTFALARYNNNGTPDQTFTTTGTVRHPVGSASRNYGANAVAIQADGKIVSVGYAEVSFNKYNFAIVRYLSSSPAYAITSAATNIDTVTVTVNGGVYPKGANTTVRFLYGTVQGVYTDSVIVSQGTVTGDVMTPVSAVLTGLTKATTYYYRISGTNDVTASYFVSIAPIGSFKTSRQNISMVPGHAVQFDGADDYVEIPHSSSLDLINNYTIEAWIKPESFSFLAGIVSKYHTSGANGYFVRLTSQAPYTGLCFDELETANDILTAGQWHHIAAVNNNGTRTLYVNGIQVPLINGSALSVQYNTDPLCIGVDYLSSPRYFNGAIEEVRIFNTALDQMQIRKDMHLTKPGSISGLVSVWQFNDGTGTTAIDSWTSNDGVFGNNPSWTASSVSLGGDISNVQIVNETGNFSFTGTNLSADITEKTGTDTIVTTLINSTPAGAMPDEMSAVAAQYWVVEKYGSGTLTTNLTLNFGEEVLDTRAETFPAGVILFKRNSNSDGEWTEVGGAASANSTTGDVTWNGISSFSQFVAMYKESELPVELISFNAISQGLRAELKWKTAVEINNYGFEIHRKVFSSEHDGLKQTQFDWENIGFVKGSGNSNSPKNYEFVDKQVQAGNYSYRLKQIDIDGSFEYSDEIEVMIGTAPLEFNLSQNYPNPFNPETIIEFTLPVNGVVSLKIYNITGEEVATLFNEFAEAGKYHRVNFNGSNLAAGIYIARLQSEDNQMMKKMVYLK